MSLARASSRITGAGTAATVIDASGLGDRVLSIAGGAHVAVTGLTIRGGQAAERWRTTGGRRPGVRHRCPGERRRERRRDPQRRHADAHEHRRAATTRRAPAARGAQVERRPGSPGAPARAVAPVAAAAGSRTRGGSRLCDSTVRGNLAGSGGPGGAGGVSSVTPGSGGTGGQGGSGGGIDNEGTLSIERVVRVPEPRGNRRGGRTGRHRRARAGRRRRRAGRAARAAGCSAPFTGLTRDQQHARQQRRGHRRSGRPGWPGWERRRRRDVQLGVSTIVNATVALNTVGPGGMAAAGRAASGHGGGIAVYASRADQSVQLENTIVSSNTGEECASNAPGAVINGGHNLSFGDRTCPATYANPRLGAPRDNGGPTATMALGRGSPAINRVPKRGAHCPATDQRGVARPQRGACDAGAFEFAVPTITILTPRSRGSYEHRSYVRARRSLQRGWDHHRDREMPRDRRRRRRDQHPLGGHEDASASSRSTRRATGP